MCRKVLLFLCLLPLLVVVESSGRGQESVSPCQLVEARLDGDRR